MTRTERTRQAIREAADACFREFGYEAAKSTEIVRRTGVAEGTVFLHYGSKSCITAAKAGLLAALTQEFYDTIQAEAERELDAPGDAVTRLRRLVDSGAPASNPTGISSACLLRPWTGSRRPRWRGCGSFCPSWA